MKGENKDDVASQEKSAVNPDDIDDIKDDFDIDKEKIIRNIVRSRRTRKDKYMFVKKSGL